MPRVEAQVTCSARILAHHRLTSPAAALVSGPALAALYYWEEGSPCAVAGGNPVAHGWCRARCPGGGAVAVQNCLGEMQMSRSGVFYAITPWNGLPRRLLRLTRLAQVQHRHFVNAHRLAEAQASASKTRELTARR